MVVLLALTIASVLLVDLALAVPAALVVPQVHSLEDMADHLATGLRDGMVQVLASISLLVPSLLVCRLDRQHNKRKARINSNHRRVLRAPHPLVPPLATLRSPTLSQRSRKQMVQLNRPSPRHLPNPLAQLQPLPPLPSSPHHHRSSLRPRRLPQQRSLALRRTSSKASSANGSSFASLPASITKVSKSNNTSFAQIGRKSLHLFLFSQVSCHAWTAI